MKNFVKICYQWRAEVEYLFLFLVTAVLLDDGVGQLGVLGAHVTHLEPGAVVTMYNIVEVQGRSRYL